jgi:hypothetical protein
MKVAVPTPTVIGVLAVPAVGLATPVDVPEPEPHAARRHSMAATARTLVAIFIPDLPS